MKKTRLIMSIVIVSACASTPEKPQQEPPDSTYQKTDVSKTIRAHRNEVSVCYGETQQKKLKVEGKLVLKFTINGQGQVVNLDPVKESSTVSDSGLINCLRHAIAFWKFPPPAENNEVEVTYPFSFKSPSWSLPPEESED